ncbi:MAG: hypothetical protein Q4P29_00045 [Tissierellia bacterium]|nr:hypothetical protein [Tissierellia bacterium]
MKKRAFILTDIILGVAILAIIASFILKNINTNLRNDKLILKRYQMFVIAENTIERIKAGESSPNIEQEGIKSEVTIKALDGNFDKIKIMVYLENNRDEKIELFHIRKK